MWNTGVPLLSNGLSDIDLGPWTRLSERFFRRSTQLTPTKELWPYKVDKSCVKLSSVDEKQNYNIQISIGIERNICHHYCHHQRAFKRYYARGGGMGV